MIPSDHFVRFYNEVFKFLEKRGEDDLRRYWSAISRQQELFCLDLFKEKGLTGMREYWENIRDEENCDMVIEEYEDHLLFRMKKCPSLSKVIDNDATPMLRYCDHCAGWAGPLIRKCGFYPVFDVISRTEPICECSIFKRREDAEKARKRAWLPLDCEEWM